MIKVSSITSFYIIYYNWNYLFIFTLLFVSLMMMIVLSLSSSCRHQYVVLSLPSSSRSSNHVVVVLSFVMVVIIVIDRRGVSEWPERGPPRTDVTIYCWNLLRLLSVFFLADHWNFSWRVWTNITFHLIYKKGKTSNCSPLSQRTT